MDYKDKYEVSQWYGWNGGDCPVHPESIVDVVIITSYKADGVERVENERAEDFVWDSYAHEPIIAFRVVKHHVEPKVIWVNEYLDYCCAYNKKEVANRYTVDALRVAVRYVETPE